MPCRRPLPQVARAVAAVAVLAALLAACGAGGNRNGAAGAGAPTTASADGGGTGTGDGGGTGTGDGIDAVGFTRFDGGAATFAAYRGKPLVVNFFASWCAPCVREMPEIERLHRELGDQVTFLGVDVRDREAEGRRLAQQTGVTYELVRDPGGDVLTAFGGAALPTTAFVTADGRLVLVQNRTYDASTLRTAIHEELLG